MEVRVGRDRQVVDDVTFPILPGMGASVKKLKVGAMDLPLLSVTSFISHSGLTWPVDGAAGVQSSG